MRELDVSRPEWIVLSFIGGIGSGVALLLAGVVGGPLVLLIAVLELVGGLVLACVSKRWRFCGLGLFLTPVIIGLVIVSKCGGFL